MLYSSVITINSFDQRVKLKILYQNKTIFCEKCKSFIEKIINWHTVFVKIYYKIK